jgi:hypothetical protein
MPSKNVIAEFFHQAVKKAVVSGRAEEPGVQEPPRQRISVRGDGCAMSALA